MTWIPKIYPNPNVPADELWFVTWKGLGLPEDGPSAPRIVGKIVGLASLSGDGVPHPGGGTPALGAVEVD